MGKAKTDYDKVLKLDLYQDPMHLSTRVSMLNADKKCVYDKITGHLLHLLAHVNNQCKCDIQPLNMFVSGVGGTGNTGQRVAFHYG